VLHTKRPIDQLLEEVRSGSHDALERLIEPYRDYLLLIANSEVRSSIRPKVAASDIVQESMLKATQSLQQFRGTSDEELRGWLRKILINQLHDTNRAFTECERRDTSREMTLVETDTESRIATPLVSRESTPSKIVGVSEDAEQLEKALAQLSPTYRELIVLRDLEEKTFVQMARILASSEDAVRNKHRRAFDALCKVLKRG